VSDPVELAKELTRGEGVYYADAQTIARALLAYREALEFYADPETYTYRPHNAMLPYLTSSIELDLGKRAREALNE